MLNYKQFEALIADVLEELGMYSMQAHQLLLGTAAVESDFGHYLRQVSIDNNPNNDALGFFQMEPDTERDIWKNYLRYRPILRMRVLKVTGVGRSRPDQLLTNIKYMIVMARLKYRRVKEPLPELNDLHGQANYWKRYYNASEYGCTVEQYKHKFRQYVG